MQRTISVRATILRSVSIFATAIGLSGCIATAVPLLQVAGAALFPVYKSIQTSTGGTIQVAFVGMDGKEAPPQPLPKVHRVAVLPGDAGDVRFAEKLMEMGRFDVTTPGRVSTILSDAKVTPDLATLTTQEQTDAFATVCRQANVDRA